MQPGERTRIAMKWFRKKKQPPLFGGGVEPTCAYCQHNAGREGRPVCSLGRKPQGDTCKKYQYDPLRREPQTAPPLRTSQYRPEDFQL